MHTTSFRIKFSFLIILLAFITTSVQGQSKWITDTNVQHRDDLRPAQTINLMAEPKDVKKAWKDFLNDRYDIDVEGIGFLSNKDLLVSEKIFLPTLKENRLDLFAKITPAENQGMAKTQMTVFGAYGYDMYVNRYDYRASYLEIRSMFNAFLKDFIPAFYEERIEDMADNISDLEKDKVKLQEDNMEIEDDITMSLNEIEMLRKDIENLEQEREENVAEIAKLETELSQDKSKLRAVKTRYEETGTNPSNK